MDASGNPSGAQDGDLPAEVATLRDTLVDAARRCNEQALRTTIDASEMFSYSFGGNGDAIAYWRQLEEARRVTSAGGSASRWTRSGGSSSRATERDGVPARCVGPWPFVG